jgi:hypothetical protein
MTRMLMGAFSTPEQADRALYELERAGYTPQDISVISQHNKYERTATGTAADTSSGVAESTATGATTGGVLGGLAGLLAGVGILPALAGLFIGGPIAAALGLAGAAAATVSGAVTGAAAGGLIGLLTGLGVPKDTAASYDRAITSGGVVLGLSGHEATIGEARAIMERNGARDLSEITPRESETTRLTDAETRADYAPGRHEPAFGERRNPLAAENDAVIPDDIDRPRDL